MRNNSLIRKMLLICMVVVLCVTSCFAEEQQIEYANQDAFLSDMAKGIQNRLAEANEDTSLMTWEENMSYYQKLVSYELNEIEKYSGQLFEDKTFNELAHFYIEACQMQMCAVKNNRNKELHNALWNGGSTCRSGIITTMYDRYNLPITAAQADNYRLVPTYSISLDDEYINYPELNGTLLSQDDLKIIESGINPDEYITNFKFTIVNESEYAIEALGLYCTITDMNGTVLGTESCWLGATIAHGKTAVLESWIQNDDYKKPFLIVPDYFEYTLSNGDYGTIDVEPNNAINSTIALNAPIPTPTFTPKPTATPTPIPTATPEPTVTPTLTPIVTPAMTSTSTIAATSTPISTSEPKDQVGLIADIAVVEELYVDMLVGCASRFKNPASIMTKYLWYVGDGTEEVSIFLTEISAQNGFGGYSTSIYMIMSGLMFEVNETKAAEFILKYGTEVEQPAFDYARINKATKQKLTEAGYIF